MPQMMKKPKTPKTKKGKASANTESSDEKPVNKPTVKFVMSDEAAETIKKMENEENRIAEQNEKIKAGAVPLGGRVDRGSISEILKRLRYPVTKPPPRATFNREPASEEEIEAVRNDVVYSTIIRNLTVITNDAPLSEKIADDIWLYKSIDSRKKVYIFLEYCRYVGVKNIGLNNSIRPSADVIVDVTNSKYDQLIPDPIRNQFNSELSAAVKRKMYPLDSIPTRPGRLDIPLNAPPVDFGIPDGVVTPVTTNPDDVIQSSDTIYSRDERVLDHAVLNGITRKHTDAYISVRDHIDAFLNPVRVAQDFTGELGQIRKSLAKKMKKGGGTPLTKEVVEYNECILCRKKRKLPPKGSEKRDAAVKLIRNDPELHCETMLWENNPSISCLTPEDKIFSDESVDKVEFEDDESVDTAEFEDDEGFAPKSESESESTCYRRDCNNPVDKTYTSMKSCGKGNYEYVGFCGPVCMIKTEFK